MDADFGWFHHIPSHHIQELQAVENGPVFWVHTVLYYEKYVNMNLLLNSYL